MDLPYNDGYKLCGWMITTKGRHHSAMKLFQDNVGFSGKCERKAGFVMGGAVPKAKAKFPSRGPKVSTKTKSYRDNRRQIRLNRLPEQ